MQRQNIVGGQSLVKVLYNFESTTSRGHCAIVQPGEVYLVLSTANDDWWLVSKPETEDGFYLPRTYVRLLETDNSVNPCRLSTCLTSTSASTKSTVHCEVGAGLPQTNMGYQGFRNNSFGADDDDSNDYSDLSTKSAIQYSANEDQNLTEPIYENSSFTVTDQLAQHDTGVTCYNRFSKSVNNYQIDSDSNVIYENTSFLNNSTSALSSSIESFHIDDTASSGSVDPVSEATQAALFSGHSEDSNDSVQISSSLDSVGQSAATVQKENGCSNIVDRENDCNTTPGAEHSDVRAPAPLTIKNPGFGMSVSVDGSCCGGSFENRHEDSVSVDKLKMTSSQRIPQRSSTLPHRKDPLHSDQKCILQGPINRCKLMEAGRKLKKCWETSYLFLLSAHLIFYKDQKSSEKKGNTYDAPQGVCDLRGARLLWAENVTKRKHVFQLELADGTVYLFHLEDPKEINNWYHSVRQVIASLAYADVSHSCDFGKDSSLYRRSFTMACSSGMSAVSTESISSSSNLDGESSVESSGSRSSKRDKLKRPVCVASVSTLNLNSGPVTDPLPSRQGIIEKLRKFFRYRPSIDSLKEKGIYKPEPVFGSSLIEICKRENGTVPRFLAVCAGLIEAKGLENDGLYRISGNLSLIQKIRCQVDQDRYKGLESEEDVHVLTGALKLFFRELQEPLFPFTMTKDFLNAIKIQNAKSRQKAFAELITKLPPVHKATLQFLLTHLLKFGPTLFSSSPSGAVSSNHDSKKSRRKSPNHNEASEVAQAAATQSNSHVAFNMIMQGQIVEYLLNKYADLLNT